LKRRPRNVMAAVRNPEFRIRNRRLGCVRRMFGLFVRRSLIPSIVLGTMLFVEGCNVGPKYRTPVVPVPDEWRVPASLSESLGNEKWWELLKDPVLQKLVRTALAQNTNIRLAAAEVAQAQAQVMATRSAEFPQVSADPSVTGERLASGISGASSSKSQTLGLYSLPGTVSYAVDFWGEYRRATEEARDSLLATEQARRNVIIGVVSSVAQDYFQLRTLDLELRQTQASVSAYRASLNLTETLFQGGATSELDVKQAQTALDTALAEVPSLNQQIGQEEDALSILLGQNPAAIPRGLGIAQQPLPPSVPAGLPSQLLERRPDVLEAAENLASEYAAVGVAKAKFFPQLALTGSGGVESTELSQIISVPALMWTAAAGFATPIFTGGLLRGNLNVAKAEQQQALITYQSTVLTAFQEVNDALIAYLRTRQQLAAQEALVNAEQGALDLADLRYQGGVDTYLNVLTAEESLFTGQITVATDRGAVLTALVQLYQALGGGWQP
jgi:outer membrane protein, multidrug efflux system